MCCSEMSTWLYLRFFQADAWGAPLIRLLRLYSPVFWQCTAVFSWTWSRNISYMSHQKEHLLLLKVPVVSRFPAEQLFIIHHEKKNNFQNSPRFSLLKSETKKSIYLSQEFSDRLLTHYWRRTFKMSLPWYGFLRLFKEHKLNFLFEWVIVGNFANLVNQPLTVTYFRWTDDDDDKTPHKVSSW